MTNSTKCNYTFWFYSHTAIAGQQMAWLYLQSIITNKIGTLKINSIYGIHMYIYIYIYRRHICSWRILYYMPGCDKKFWHS